MKTRLRTEKGFIPADEVLEDEFDPNKTEIDVSGLVARKGEKIGENTVKIKMTDMGVEEKK